MADYAAMYRDLRGRVAGVVRHTDPALLDAVAPAAPDWRVRDLVAHLDGVCADVVSGNLDGVATDPWTAAQVDTRRAWTIEQVLDEWDETGRGVEAIIHTIPDLPAWQTFIADAVTHEHDIRGAVAQPGARDSDALVAMANVAVDGLGAHLASGQHGTLTIALDDDAPTTVGSGPIATSLRISRFEFVRSLTGRRSVAQIEAYDWGSEPQPEWLVFGIFTPRRRRSSSSAPRVSRRSAPATTRSDPSSGTPREVGASSTNFRRRRHRRRATAV